MRSRSATTIWIKTVTGEPRRSAFWMSLSLDELIAQQQVAPIADFGSLDSIWSEGDVFDDALSEVWEDRALHRRRERRAD